VIRKAIKDGYNLYLKQLQPGGKYTPQTPKFGFILRSAVVKAFPGLHIDIPFPTGVDTTVEARAPICHLTAINDTTLMCLLDRLPEELQIIMLTQPPHQQRFSLGENIALRATKPDGTTIPASVEFELLELVTDKNHIPLGDQKEWERLTPISSTKVWSEETRCMDMPELKKLILENMTKESNKSHKFYNDDVVTSLPIALQLNDPCYYLNYKNLTPVYKKQTPRQLWSGSTTGASTMPTTPPPAPSLPIASPNLPTAKNPPSQPAKAPITLTPPHIQTGISTTPTLKGTGPAISGTPHIQYTISIYPDYLPYAKASHPDFTIPTHNTYLMDLVFSVKRTNLPSGQDTFSLGSIVLDIPLSPADGSKPGPKDPEPLLKYPYSGPGPRMLSNLRFTVSLNRVGNILQCVLVPRGKLAISMLDRRLMDLSFKLSQCEIAEIVTAQGISYPRNSGKSGVVTGLGVCKVFWREGYTFAEGGKQGVASSEDPVLVFKDKGGSDAF
jgi:hypothetical protein